MTDLYLRAAILITFSLSSKELKLVCSCGWTVAAEANDPKGTMLTILKDIHERTFAGHKAEIE